MAGCGENVEVYLPKGWDYKRYVYKCGNTLPSGYPALCDPCTKIHADTDWRREAADAGEAWGEDDY